MISLPTGVGKTVNAVAVAIEAARQGQRLTVVVKGRHEVAEFKEELEAAWAGLDEAASSLAAPDGLRSGSRAVRATEVACSHRPGG
ncbi:hypothetical protein [Streptomyces sp. MS1.AVA.4]|uniref:Uncharacterized protein n=1 Tax=Streptomyces pratisoli TaxID=3139917 RepID=A0ACC6QFU2_9ACTN